MNRTYLWIALILLGIILLAVIAWLLIRGAQKRKGVFYHNQVGLYLKRWCAVRRYKLLENPELVVKGRHIRADFIIIGIFGVLFINVFSKDADLYGNDGDPLWTAKKSQTSKESFPNPIDQCDSLIAAVRDLFGGQKIYNLQMEQFYVFPCRRFKYFVADRYPVVTLPKLKAVLTRDKYHEEKQVDMEKLEEILRSSLVS